jgi:hypothetical protein
MDQRILDLSTSWRQVVSFTPRPLYSAENRSQYPLNRRLSGPKNPYGRREEEKIVAPTWTPTPILRPPSP